MTEHTVSSYDDDLRNLTGRIAEMGGQAESMVEDAINALVRQDVKAAQATAAKDRAINKMEQQIEETAVLIIARRQPMAQDLRQIIAALRIATDLERVADLGKNIARSISAMDGKTPPKQLLHGIEHMAEIVLEQMRMVLDAYTTSDSNAAIAVVKRDDEVDAIYKSLFREFLTYMMEDPRNITFCANLLFAAKHLERVGDHATNIAESVYYVDTGKVLEDGTF
ncbi:phosphate uptake regulator, PhoU [Cohaesibacter marisflavi]|uniref:Phosphate-specific transport system accessory protein PhoU n=1 Tax=Cohaesibacter marisflavi TaxID=655353 RepID=A0A1I5D3V3_9HYPH|nr:phosphate signaling complex protein PhoU [Cohaesibacter marisflavi]SFN93833.1 phosphate uptake regulator, PhoU [Cohaesibacter marisflavi]